MTTQTLRLSEAIILPIACQTSAMGHGHGVRPNHDNADPRQPALDGARRWLPDWIGRGKSLLLTDPSWCWARRRFRMDTQEPLVRFGRIGMANGTPFAAEIQTALDDKSRFTEKVMSGAGHGADRFNAWRAGFTMLELLIVVAMIGIMVALLLPAIQSSREMARRTQCLNHLSQLMLALHSYELAHRAFPPGTVDARRPIVSRAFGYHHGWIEQVVPFLEEKAIYHQADRQFSAYDFVNHAVRIELPSLVCPSQVIEGEGYSCYAAVHHHVEWPIDVRQQGVFFLNSRIRLDDVTDGLANTLFLGEKLIEPGDLGWYSGTRSILRNTGEPMNTASRIRRTQFWKVNGLPPDMSTMANQQGTNLMGGTMGFLSSDGLISYDERPFTEAEMLALTEPLGHVAETQGIGSSSERSPSDPGNRSLELPVEPAKPPASSPASDSADPATAATISPGPSRTAAEVAAAAADDSPTPGNRTTEAPVTGSGEPTAQAADSSTVALTTATAIRPRLAPLFVGGFAGSHAGGVMFAFGDGSVRFLAESIDGLVYQNLGNRADGEWTSLEPHTE